MNKTFLGSTHPRSTKTPARDHRIRVSDLFCSCRPLFKEIYQDHHSKCRLMEYDFDIDLFYHAQQQLHPGAARESSRRTSPGSPVFSLAANCR